ncbi:RNA polymerase factor sigma-54 [Chitinibacteraceae bacterium HSL-7]
MKASLQLKLSQQLTLTPQLQQSIKLLQMSTLDFRQEIERYLLENPLLEAGDDRAVDDAPDGDNDQHDDPLLPDPWGSGGGGGDDDFDPASAIPYQLTLREHLLEQARLLRLGTVDHALLRLLIDALDDDGLLTQTLEEILELIPVEVREQEDIGPDELNIALTRLQQLEPTGVGARGHGEVLLLQLRQHAPSDLCQRAQRIVSDHLDLLAARDYTRLKKALSCSDAELKETCQLITSLTPRPAADFGATSPNYITPDVVVYKHKGRWKVRLNDAARPRIRINQLYAGMLAKSEGAVLNRELQEARWLVKSVEQRFDTIFRVAEAIVQRQHAFFEHGEIAMRPMVLRDIADEVDLHESTISRVTTQKYLLCPRGVFEFKYFFGSHVETDTGGEASATAIKALIRQLIQNEDKQKPLSDGALAEALSQQGIAVARRTVAKYREAMQIAPVSQRKQL